MAKKNNKKNKKTNNVTSKGDKKTDSKKKNDTKISNMKTVFVKGTIVENRKLAVGLLVALIYLILVSIVRFSGTSFSVWQVLEFVGMNVGMLTVIPAIYAAWKTGELSARAKVRTRFISSETKESNVVTLCVSVGNPITSDVAKFLNVDSFDLNKGVYINNPKSTFKCCYYGNDINKVIYSLFTESNMPTDNEYDKQKFISDYINELLEISKILKENSIEEINLFIGAPSILGPLIGNVFSNRFRINMYHFTRGDIPYVFMGKIGMRLENI